MVNWLIFCSFVFSLAMTLLGLMVDFSYHLSYQPRIEEWQNQQKDQLSSYLAKEKSYQKHPLFRPRPHQKKDFSQLLSDLRKGDKQQELVPAKTKKDILSLGDQWIEQKHKIKHLPTVLQLFQNIEEYDYWSPEQEDSSDNTINLIVASQIFLASTFYNEPELIREALKKTRHLSQILLQTQGLNFKRAGLSLLEKEHSLMEFLNSRFLKSRTLWTPVPLSDLRDYRKHLEQTTGYLSLLTKASILEKIFLNSETPIGFCSAYIEKQELIEWGEPYLEKQFLFEPDFSDKIKTLSRIKQKAQTHCQLVKSKSRQPKQWIQHIPYYRRIFAIKMLLKAEHSGYIL